MKPSSSKSCVLAYSGGLDTSAAIPWLIDKGYEVHALLVDVGQQEDLEALCARAIELGATTGTIRDARPAMAAHALPWAIGLDATYEGSYRLGTALARPFIALEQVKLAKSLGCTALAHGATGKGNDQVRFEFAYRSLAPECEIIAPWKEWEFEGRKELVAYLETKGIDLPFEVNKELSLDENMWHLSVEGGELEDPEETVAVEDFLAAVSDRFAVSAETPSLTPPDLIELEFVSGTPIAVDGEALPLIDLVEKLNHLYRNANWAWDLVLENRFTGVKSRGLYINPAAKLFHYAVDGLSRASLSKPAYDLYRDLGNQYANLLYRGEYFSQQRPVLEAAAKASLKTLTGKVTVRLSPVPHVVKVSANSSLFRKEVATFEKSDFTHADAAGFIHLSWLSSVGTSTTWDENDEVTLETEGIPAPGLSTHSGVPGGGLVSSPL